MKRLQALLQGMLVLALSLALPAASFANFTNTASVTFADAANTNYGPIASNTVTITTPPVVTAPANLTLDVGVTMTSVQVSATNSPTGYALSGQPTGITISNTGLISGTPGTGSAGPYTVTITATNAAGNGTATFSITVRGPATIALTKTSDVAHVLSGGTVTFTIAYTNSGSGTASNVVITDVIPTGSTYVASSASTGGTFNSVTNTITWTIPTLIAGGSGTVTFKVTAN